jgi:hypothetical protein
MGRRPSLDPQKTQTLSILDFGFWILDFRLWSLVFGLWAWGLALETESKI